MATNIANANSATQNQKPRRLPDPYLHGILPNPYALPTEAEAASVQSTEEQAKNEEKKPIADLLRYTLPQSYNRPQPKGKAKVNTTVKNPVAPTPQMSSSSTAAPTNVQKRGLEYYQSTPEDDAANMEAKRERERQERRKKKDAQKFRKLYGNWWPDKEYKLNTPTNIIAYKATGAYAAKLDGFQAYLRAARGIPSPRSLPRNSSEDTSEPRPQSASKSPAAPDSPTFALPSFDEPSTSSPPPAAPIAQTSEEVHQHRLRLSQEKAKKLGTAMPQAQPQASPEPSPPPPPMTPPEAEDAAPPPPPPPPAPALAYNPTIYGAPVYYNLPQPSGPTEPTEPPAKKQKKQEKQEKQETIEPSKAEHMMATMGYVKGQGLGKNSDGITTALEVKARKDQASRQMRDEFESDGKTIKSQQVFDIKGGHRIGPKDHGPFGEPSRVILTWGCVAGVDFTSDADRDDGGIRQEMGDAFEAKFGAVERIHINMDSDPMPVYIQFHDPLCALNAVNRLREGHEIRGLRIRAVFYDEHKFNHSVYDH